MALAKSVESESETDIELLVELIYGTSVGSGSTGTTRGFGLTTGFGTVGVVEVDMLSFKVPGLSTATGGGSLTVVLVTLLVLRSTIAFL